MSAAPVDLPVPTFKIDAKVIDRAGSIAGAYLDNIGKTDLADLTPNQWSKFCMLLVGNAFLIAGEDYRESEVPF